MRKLNIVEIYKLSLKGLIRTKSLKLSNQKFNKEDHKIVIEFILQNNIIITDHIDIDLVKNPKLLQNISWKIINNQIKFRDLFEYFIDNDIKLGYIENIETIQNYIHTIPEYMIQKLSKEKIIELIVNPLKGVKLQGENQDENNNLIHSEHSKCSDSNTNTTPVTNQTLKQTETRSPTVQIEYYSDDDESLNSDDSFESSE